MVIARLFETKLLNLLQAETDVSSPSLFFVKTFFMLSQNVVTRRVTTAKINTVVQIGESHTILFIVFLFLSYTLNYLLIPMIGRAFSAPLIMVEGALPSQFCRAFIASYFMIRGFEIALDISFATLGSTMAFSSI